MFNPLSLIPAKYRATLYFIAGLANVIVIYLAATGHVGVGEMGLFTSLISFLGLGTAGSNMTPVEPAPSDPIV